MKIAFVYTSPFPAKRGFSAADRRVRDLIRGLSAAGAEISLCVPYYHFGASISPNEESFSIHYLGRFSFRRFKLLNRIAFWFSLLRYIRVNNIGSVILYNTQADSVFFAKELKRRGIKVVVEICDLHSNSDSFNFKASLAQWTERELSKIGDLIITISEYLKEVIQKHNPSSNILKIPILVDTEFFLRKKGSYTETSIDKVLDTDSFLICYVGGLWHHQGVRFLIHAFKKIIDDGVNAKLLIAGKYDISPSCDDVEGIIRELKLENDTILPGWVDTISVKKIMDRADLLVISQIDHPFAQAGLPTKLAEYAACGRPILITNVGDITYYFKHWFNCVICEPSNSESMYESFKLIINNPNKAKEISLNAQLLAEQIFDYKVNGEIIFSSIREL